MFAALWTEIDCLTSFSSASMTKLSSAPQRRYEPIHSLPVSELIDFGLCRGKPEYNKTNGSVTQLSSNDLNETVGPYTCWLVMTRYSSSLSDWRETLFKDAVNGDSNKGPNYLWLCFNVYLHVIEAVEKLHRRHIIHFDIKCDNILIRSNSKEEAEVSEGQEGRIEPILEVTDELSVVLTDFGKP